MITAENLSRSYPNKELFRNLCFTLGKGICLVEGKSGCGKTTLLRILSGLEKPVNGRVLYSKRNFSFAACGQESSLYGEYSLKKNIRILKPDYCQKEREEVAERLGFSFFDKPLVSLSGEKDKKQRLLSVFLKEPMLIYWMSLFLHWMKRQNLLWWMFSMRRHKIFFLSL